MKQLKDKDKAGKLRNQTKTKSNEDICKKKDTEKLFTDMT